MTDEHDRSEADLCGGECTDGTPCKRPAGWGTDHVGEGRCKLHGGNAGRPPEHGLYSETAREEIAERIEAAREQPIGEIRAEVAVVRGLLQDYLTGVENADEDTIGDITTLVAEVRRAANVASKMDAREALTTRHVEYLQTRFADILTEYVSEERLDAALRDLRNAVQTDESALDI